MKTIGNIKELLTLESDLTMFILESCPWLREEWIPESLGYLFVLDSNDIQQVTSVITTPHLIGSDDNYIEQMTIDLERFDYWEKPAIYDQATGYWNVVAILGEEYGCTLFMSSDYVESIPALQQRLNLISQQRQYA